MEVQIAQSGAHSPPLRVSRALQVAANAVRVLVLRLDAGIVRRRRAAADRAVLASMSDYELRDIGVSRGSFEANAMCPWRPDSQP